MNSNILQKPRITEKAAMVAEHQVYTFNVNPSATKQDVRKAIKELYKVTPVKVHMITIHQKNVTVRGRAGKRAGGRKAMVYLKKGDKIEFV